MYLYAAQPVFVEARAGAAAEGLHVDVVLTRIGGNAAEVDAGYRAVASRYYLVRHDLGHCAEYHVRDALRGVAASCAGGGLCAAEDAARAALDVYRPVISSVGGKRRVDDAAYRVVDRCAQRAERQVYRALYLVGVVGEVELYVLVLYRNLDVELYRVAPEAVGIEVILKFVRAVGNRGKSHAYLSLGVVEQLLHAERDGLLAVLGADVFHALHALLVAGELGVEVSEPDVAHAAVEQYQIQYVLVELAFAEYLHCRDSDAFGVDGIRVGRVRAGDSSADVVVVRDVGDEGDYLTVVEDRGSDRDVRKMRSAAVVRVVCDEHVARLDLFELEVPFYLSDKAEHRTEVHRYVFSLGYRVSGCVEQRTGAVFSFLDVRRVGGFHQNGAHFLRYRHERVSYDFQQDSVDFHSFRPPCPDLRQRLL